MKTLDMTQGKPSGLLLRFAFPMMLSMLLQQCYSMCDSLLVGRFLGDIALTATGSAGNLSWIAQNLVCCAIYGYGVALSQRFGAKDEAGYQRFLAGALVLSIFWGLLVTILGTTCAEVFLKQLGTPDELLRDASEYLRTLWGGFLALALMNLFSTALTSMGDSKTPLVALAISSAVNIVLDVVFLAWLHMGIGGAALATVIAQITAALWNFRALVRRGNALPRRQHFRLRWKEVRELLRLSLPQMLSSIVINSGDLLVQSIINGYGVVFVMGVNAARRYFSMLNIVGYGLECAVATYVGQNWGAGKKDRIRTGTRFAVTLGFAASAATGALVCLGAEPLIRFLLTDSSGETIRVGVEALRMLAAFLPGLYLLCEFRAAIQGMGNVVYPMLSGFSELIMRVGAVFILPALLGRTGMYFVDPCAWVPTMLLMVAGYRSVLFRRKKDLLRE